MKFELSFKNVIIIYNYICYLQLTEKDLKHKYVKSIFKLLDFIYGAAML